MIGRMRRPRLSLRGAMILVAAVGLVLGVGLLLWRAAFSPAERWLRVVRNPDSGFRYETAQEALLGRNSWVSPEMATGALIAALKDPNWNVRSDAACVLGRGGKRAEAAVPALIETMGDREDFVRAAAARSLATIILDGGRGREQVILELIGALGDRKHRVRGSAAYGLGSLVRPGDPDAGATIAALRARLADESPAVRVAACWSLIRLGHPRECVPVLIGAIDDPATEVRAFAVSTLGDTGVGTAEVIRALEARVRDEDNAIIQGEAQKALKRCSQGGK